MKMKSKKLVWVLLTVFCMLFTLTGCADLNSVVEYLEYIEYAEETEALEEVQQDEQLQKDVIVTIESEESEETDVVVVWSDEESADAAETSQEETVVSESEELAEESLAEEAFTEESLVEESSDEELLDRDGSYTTAEDVALYLHLYGELPGNFMTKNDARDLGWEGGSLEKFAPGMCIGGDRFGNYEGDLPKKKGRTYQECDIDTLGKKSRGAKRIVFSNDGLIYYTEDHYETFTLLYGEE